MAEGFEINRRRLLGGAVIAATAAAGGTSAMARKVPATKAQTSPGFLWGAATSGYQVEGNNINGDFWFLEHVKLPGGHSPFADKSGDACDHYHRFADDIKILAGLGLNSYRFSLEWSRIEPEKGEFSNAELDHYRRMAATCREHGVTPCITFNHFTTPRWFSFEGGWDIAASADLFARYCEFAVKGVGDLAGLATTLNEPNVGLVLQWSDMPSEAKAGIIAMPGMIGTQSPTGTFSIWMAGDQGMKLPNMLKAHEKAYDVIKGGPGDFPVGVSLAITDDQAVGKNSQRDAKRAACYEPWMELISDKADFIGVQNYSRLRFDENGPMKPPAGAELTSTGEEFYPEALGNAIRYAHERTKKPIYITENGIATDDDQRRVVHMRRAIASMKSCIDDGIPVRGYFHWSLLDNYEWGKYAPRFGLVAVDRETQVRTPKPSAHELGAQALAHRF